MIFRDMVLFIEEKKSLIIVDMEDEFQGLPWMPWDRWDSRLYPGMVWARESGSGHRLPKPVQVCGNPQTPNPNQPEEGDVLGSDNPETQARWPHSGTQTMPLAHLLTFQPVFLSGGNTKQACSSFIVSIELRIPGENNSSFLVAPENSLEIFRLA